MTRREIGTRLTNRIIDYAKSRGIQEIFGDVLVENSVMRKLARRFGFSESKIPGDPGIVRVSKRL